MYVALPGCLGGCIATPPRRQHARGVGYIGDPYGPDGRLLENVRLYDQDGPPFSSLTYDGCMVDEMTGEQTSRRSTSSRGRSATTTKTRRNPPEAQY